MFSQLPEPIVCRQPEEPQGLPDARTLWQQFKGGDKQSFSVLYKTHYAALYNYGCHLVRDKDLVEDSIHDLFFTLWKNRDQLTMPLSVRHYLFTAFKRKVIDLTRQQGRFSDRYSESDFEIILSPENELIHEQAREERVRQLQRALNGLTKRQREAIYLRYFENMTYPELASVLECDVNSVYVLMSRAMDALRQSFCPLIFLALLGQ
jgi:RNA polymerase sigma factor (sigma-70 family)